MAGKWFVDLMFTLVVHGARNLAPHSSMTISFPEVSGDQYFCANRESEEHHFQRWEKSFYFLFGAEVVFLDHSYLTCWNCSSTFESLTKIEKTFSFQRYQIILFM